MKTDPRTFGHYSSFFALGEDNNPLTFLVLFGQALGLLRNLLNVFSLPGRKNKTYWRLKSKY